MSLYNLVHGYSPACLYIMPMLGMKNTDIPRFRDCFVDAETETITIFTRVGGNNRNCGYGEEMLMEHECFLRTYDWEDDSTYGLYDYKVPEKWKADFDAIMQKRPQDVSDEYVDVCCEWYPKIAEQLRAQFKRVESATDDNAVSDDATKE